MTGLPIHVVIFMIAIHFESHTDIHSEIQTLVAMGLLFFQK